MGDYSKVTRSILSSPHKGKRRDNITDIYILFLAFVLNGLDLSRRLSIESITFKSITIAIAS